MTSNPTQAPITAREYRVQLVSTEVYDLWIKAENADAAIEQTEALWLDIGPETFIYRDGNIEDVSIVGEREVQA